MCRFAGTRPSRPKSSRGMIAGCRPSQSTRRRILSNNGVSGLAGTSVGRLEHGSAWSVCLCWWRLCGELGWSQAAATRSERQAWAFRRQRRLKGRLGGWPRSHARELHRAGCEITAAQSACVNLAVRLPRPARAMLSRVMDARPDLRARSRTLAPPVARHPSLPVYQSAPAWMI